MNPAVAELEVVFQALEVGVVRRAEGEDIAEFDELLAGLKELGCPPTITPARKPGVRNVKHLKRLFQENGWGELTKDTKAKIVLHTTDLWRDGAHTPHAMTLDRAKKLFAVVNASFETLHARAATPV